MINHMTILGQRLHAQRQVLPEGARAAGVRDDARARRRHPPAAAVRVLRRPGRHGKADYWLRPSKVVVPTHVAFRAPTRAAVNEFYKEALAAGATSNGAPGLPRIPRQLLRRVRPRLRRLQRRGRHPQPRIAQSMDARYFAFRGRDLLVRHDGDRALVPARRTWGHRSASPRCARTTSASPAPRRSPSSSPTTSSRPRGWRSRTCAASTGARRRGRRRASPAARCRSSSGIATTVFCGRCGGADRARRRRARRAARAAATAPTRALARRSSCSSSATTARCSARNARFPLPFYSTLAGFVEVGETLEETVAPRDPRGGRHRGARRALLRQPAVAVPRLADDRLHRALGGRRARARPRPSSPTPRWFARDELPLVPPRLSIARALIDDFVRRHGGDPDGLKSIS